MAVLYITDVQTTADRLSAATVTRKYAMLNL